MKTDENAKESYNVVKKMYPKVELIFKMRMRSCTFPTLSMSDLARVMRDLGLIPNIRRGMSLVKEVWFHVK